MTYFHADLDQRDRAGLPAATFICSPFNRSGVSTQDGVEIAGRYALTPELTLGGGLHLPRCARGYEAWRRCAAPAIPAAWTSTMSSQGRGNFNLAAIYNGGRRTDLVTDAFGFVGTRATRALDAYWLVRAAASYKLQPGVEVFGRVENLLDQHYQEVFGYNATPGIAAFAGVKLTFGGPEGVGGSWAK